MKPFVIIPAHNEEKNISKVIVDAKKQSSNIIVVDDGSTDKTYDIALKSSVIVLRHVLNLGKGAALRTGTEYALREGADIVVYIDSDGQHNPSDMPRLLKALKNHDIVFTYRDLGSVQMPATKKLGNWVLNTLSKKLFNIRIKDTQCGYKIIKTSAYKKMDLISNDYLIESEIVAKVGMHNLEFTQEPIATIYADKYRGTNVFHGMSIAMRMLWWKVNR